MSQAKVKARIYNIPEDLKSEAFEQEKEYRKKFKLFIERIWKEKDSVFSELRF